jgi:carbamoyltransferase
MTAILGISAYYHDSAAALLIDGEIVAAAQEERFTRVKHDERWPGHAIDFCLKRAGLTRSQVDAAVFYEKPLTKFERIVDAFLAEAPRGLAPFLHGVPLWAGHRLHIPKEIRREMNGGAGAEGAVNGAAGPWRGKLLFAEHHRSHAASAFYPSPFEEAAVLTIDGVGEWATTTIAHGDGSKLEMLSEIRFPHSLGLLYSAFTYFCGFKVNSGEYKLMGLAPYGQPKYAALIREKLIDLADDGSFRLNMEYFNYTRGKTMTAGGFERLFGGPARNPETPITRREMDLAASVQAVTEEAMARLAAQALRVTGSRNLCLAGGVALNCVGNGKILASGLADGLWIQPAAGDAGGALGAALDVWHNFYKAPRQPQRPDAMHGSLLGPDWTDDEIAKRLVPYCAVGKVLAPEELPDAVAELIATENVVGWFHGRMEFGPRALGARSIVGDARSPKMQSTMNLKIKFRESFRPFAPCVLVERASEWFGLPEGQESPYMLLVAPVLEKHRTKIDANPAADADANAVAVADADASAITNAITNATTGGGIGGPEGRRPVAGGDRREPPETGPHAPEPQRGEGNALGGAADLSEWVNRVRSTVPAITHVDYSARVQTVDRERHGAFYDVIKAFERKTGCPVIINTSFNIRGEPIVCRPEEAYRCFMLTDMDALVLGHHLLLKKDQPPMPGAEEYRRQFKLD